MSDQLTFSVTSAGARTTVVALNGELDSRTMLKAREVLCAQVEAGAHRLVVDLSGLSFIAVLGAHLLRDIQALLNARGGSLVLACPQRRVARALQLTGTDQQIPVYDSLGSAVSGRVCLTERRIR